MENATRRYLLHISCHNNDMTTPRQKILFASSEAAPLIKTGGLADVAGSLPLALQALGHDVRLILPAYPDVLAHATKIRPISELNLGHIPEGVRILKAEMPASGLPLYLVDAPVYFNRPGNPYHDHAGKPYPDNPQRFALFCRAIVVQALGQVDAWQPDLVHCNDWQTGLVAPLLADEWQRPATVFTIHNLAYQGVYDRAVFDQLALPEYLWQHDGLEFYGKMSFIKGGIAFSDAVTTVSPTYAKEICEPHLGYGMDGLLRHRADRLFGILNGIDTEVWNPRTDPLIPGHYHPGDLSGKRDDKRALQEAFGLPERDDKVILGHIGRLVEQKGVDLIIEALPRLIAEPDTQLVVLGSGDPLLENALRGIAEQYPDRVGIHIGYNEPLAHLLEAGSDCFLMPSRFEPCGLNQMYSLRYGTVPIVHKTGGLADTVIDADTRRIVKGDANGFVFEHPTPEGLWWALERALAYHRRPPMWWEKLMLAGMRQDFSWSTSAAKYLDVYAFAQENPARSPVYPG